MKSVVCIECKLPFVQLHCGGKRRYQPPDQSVAEDQQPDIQPSKEQTRWCREVAFEGQLETDQHEESLDRPKRGRGRPRKQPKLYVPE